MCEVACVNSFHIGAGLGGQMGPGGWPDMGPPLLRNSCDVWMLVYVREDWGGVLEGI